MTARTFTYAPTADMLAEAFEDGTPCHWTVYAADGSPIGAVAAGLSAREWLPTGPTPGDHGPVFGDLRDAARWVAERAGTSSCGARRPGWTAGPAWGRKRLLCALPEDHDGRHTNAFGDTWSGTEVPNDPHADAAREAARHSSANDTHEEEDADMSTNITNRHDIAVRLPDVDATAALLASLLVAACADVNVPRRLKEAVRVFAALDDHLRAGWSGPLAWDAAEWTETEDVTTDAYDAVSSALRTRPEEGPLRDALDAARAEWVTLDGLMTAGHRAPEPWVFPDADDV